MRRATAALAAVLALTGAHGVANAMNGMSGMGGMSGMSGMSGMGGMAGPGVTVINVHTGQPGMSGMGGMAGMSGMSGMSGTAAMAVPRQKVVYHINGDDPRLQSLALGNLQNHINAIGKDNIELKVVLHGDGVALLLYPDALSKTKMKAANATEETQSKITGLKQLGVQFQVCATTLKSRNIDAKDLYDFDPKDLVPSGVAQLGILQSQGYAYVKP